MSRYLFTSESVTEGHPDKLCDQISDALVDAILAKEAQLEAAGYVDAEGNAARVDQVRTAIETFATTGTIVVMGELRCQAYVDVQAIVRDCVARVGYTRAKYGFDASTCGVLNLIHEQSPDIAQGVDGSFARAHAEDVQSKIGAGDQGMMFGYATNETSVFMPMPIYIAHKLARHLSQLRKSGRLAYLRPDGKTQVSIVYEQDKPVAVDAIVVSTQHDESIDLASIRHDIYEQLITEVMEEVGLPYKDARIFINPTGRFVVGGPMGDTGLTGRKIIVDTYGGMGRHGGGAFSGKDATKVDRSGAYAARYVAKNIVAAGLAERCELELSYAIGIADPVSIMVDTKGTGVLPDERLEQAVREVFDLRPGAIIRDLNLLTPQFSKTAAYGHFGREDVDFSWERCDKLDELRAACSALA